jgi:outer membrane protein assembly factor BamB
MRAVIWSLVACSIVCGCNSSSAASSSRAHGGTAVENTGPRSANGMIVDAASGHAVGAVSANDSITAAVSDGSGGWFIAGSFTQVDGHPRASVAHVRADGSLDTAWRGPDIGPPAALTFLSLARSGTRLLLAGGFSLEGRRPGVVALRAADGSLDPAWATPPVCSDGAWAVRADAGRAWVATACAAPPCIVAVSGATGHSIAWSPGVAAVGETGCVNDIAFAGYAVFFTGGFTAVGGVPREGIAAADASNGRVLAAFAPSGSCAQGGHAIAVARGRVFVGGDACPIAAFASTSGRQLWAVARRGGASTNALLAISGRVYVGGAFTRLGGVVAHGLVGLDARTGHAVATWHLPPSTDVYALAPSSGRILVGAN